MTFVYLQISLERMDELFGVADFHGLEDVGLAAQHGAGLEKSQVERVEETA